MKELSNRIVSSMKKNVRLATLNFAFIIAYVNIFPKFFGPENTITAVIFTILMSASMVRDMTTRPVKHLLTQGLVLSGMAACAFLVTQLSPLHAFFINFGALFFIIYVFTYEYSDHMYFPYILSYLFLVFLSPVTEDQLPRRILAMLAGAVSIILYQLFMGRKNAEETARDVLCTLADQADQAILYLLGKYCEAVDPAKVRHTLCRLSRTVYDRRKKPLCISEASAAMIDAGRGLENLILLLQDQGAALAVKEQGMLKEVSEQLQFYRAYLREESLSIPVPDQESFLNGQESPESGVIFHTLVYVRDRLLHMTDPDIRFRCPRTVLSVKVRLAAALDISPVRVIYAFRAALILALATLIVKLLGLPHGKWLLFTLASVSLPYANDVPAKIRKRVAATVIGGLISVPLFAVVGSSGGRTALMMLSGYVSFFINGYTGTFACSTIGALGGAVFLNAFGFRDVGSMFLIRIGYVCMGVLIGYILNCLVVPYKREHATKQLWEKYKSAAELLTKVCRGEHADPQLYYSLVIRVHLLEDKLMQNADISGWEHVRDALFKYRAKVRRAHRELMEGREHAPVFSLTQPDPVR